MPLPFLIYFIIFLEGYAVLASELLAIRLMVPFVGGGTDTVSIIIAFVLLPLAVGYYWGGRFKSGKTSCRRVLTRNLALSIAVLSVGLSYDFLDQFFGLTTDFIPNRLLFTIIYTALFIAPPVFMLGQTIPLISRYLPRRDQPDTTGMILFFSTVGSFAGSILSTLIFMAFLGVNYTVIITIACLLGALILISRRRFSFPLLGGVLFFGFAVLMNSPMAMQRLKIVENNVYNVIQIVENKTVRYLRLNNTLASAVWKDKSDTYFHLNRYMEKAFFPPADMPGVKSVLVLGAGGFTFGRNDEINNYTYVDLDSSLQRIAEEHLLQEKIGPNKKFVAMDARAFLRQLDVKYDIIIVDLYRDHISPPESVLTREFFLLVKESLAPDGIMGVNFYISPTFDGPYAYNVDATLKSVFPALNRQIISPGSFWAQDSASQNVIYSFINKNYPVPSIYTDNKSTVMFDTPKGTQYKKFSQVKED